MSRLCERVCGPAILADRIVGGMALVIVRPVKQLVDLELMNHRIVSD